MHPARKPLATLAITLGTFLIILGAPALAGADDSTTADLDGGAIAQARDSAELAAADDDTDGATAVGTDQSGTDADGATADAADGTAVVGAGSAVAADSVAVDGVAISGDNVVGANVAVEGAAEGATTDGGTDTDGTSVVGTDQAGQNGDNGAGNNGAGQNSDDGNSTGADGGGDPTPAANDPVLANNSGIAPAASQNTDRQIPETGGPASMIVLMTGIALILAGVVFLAYGRGRALARHLA